MSDRQFTCVIMGNDGPRFLNSLSLMVTDPCDQNQNTFHQIRLNDTCPPCHKSLRINPHSVIISLPLTKVDRNKPIPSQHAREVGVSALSPTPHDPTSVRNLSSNGSPLARSPLPSAPSPTIVGEGSIRRPQSPRGS